MPKKINEAPAGSSEGEVKPKPRKKTVRKTKKTDGPDLSSLPNTATPVHMDSIAKPISADDLHNQKADAVVFVPEEVEAVKHEAMRDIKPRETPAFQKQSDATFLVPEKFGFNLKTEKLNQDANKSKFIRTMAVFIIVVILLLLGGLFYMSSYSSKIMNSTNSNVAVSGDHNLPANASPAGYTLAYSNVPADLSPILTSLLQAKFGKDYGYSNYTVGLPAVNADTLFVKKSDDARNVDLLNELANYGIKPEIQQLDSLQTSAVLALTSTVAKPDLTGLTSAVYNATGVSGLAKKYCGILTSYKVTSCNPLNAITTQTGSTVKYKTVKALFTLKRTADFKNDVFSPADSKQVEDIAVTLGK